MKTSRLTRTLVAAVSALALAGGVAACTGESASEKAAREVGSQSKDRQLVTFAPDQRAEPVKLAGETIEGGTWDSTEQRGKVIVINLWGSWCGPCAKEAPHLVDAQQETKGDDVEFAGINSRESSKETGLAQAKEWGFTWPSVYDKSGATAIDMQGVMTAQPSTAVLDREGRIAAVVLGPVTTSTLVGLIEDTLAEAE